MVPPAQSEQSDQAFVVFWRASKTVAVEGMEGSGDEVDPVVVPEPDVPVVPVDPVVLVGVVPEVEPDGPLPVVLEGVPLEVLLTGVTNEAVVAGDPPQANRMIKDGNKAARE